MDDVGVRAPSLTVAAAQPACRARDVAGNAEAHARVVRATQARVVVFPELSLTGYELDAAPVACEHDVLIPIIDACAAAGSLALVGAPVEEQGRRFIAMLVIDGAGARPAYRKTWLGGNESTQFHPGDGPTVLEVDGWRLGLGICKDTGAAQHVAGIAALNVDAYLAGLVHRLPLKMTINDSRLDPSCLGALQEVFYWATNADYEWRLAELAFGTNVGIAQSIDWSYNSQFNEGIGGMHIALGDGRTGFHIDFICPGGQLEAPGSGSISGFEVE